MEDKANAVLQLLPDEAYESAETSQEGELWRIKLEGVDDSDREIDTVVHYCQTLLAPKHRLTIQHPPGATVIDLQQRQQ